MPKMDVQIGIYSDEGFTEKIYRNEIIIIGSKKEKFGKNDLHLILRFIRLCIDEFNRGVRGIRNGRNHDRFTEEKTKSPDPCKIREVVKKIEERFKGAE